MVTTNPCKNLSVHLIKKRDVHNEKDGYTITPAQDINLPFLTLKTALKSITDRTGTHALAVEQEAYIADHMAIKKYKPYKLLSEDNISLTVRGEGYTRKGMVEMLRTSTDLQQMMVGATHELAYTSEIGVHIYHSCKDMLAADDVDSLPEWMKDINMLLSGYELYENPLGGLSWDVYDALQHFTSHMYDRRNHDTYNADATIIEGWLRKGGLNASKTTSFMNIAEYVGYYRKATKEGIIVDTRLVSSVAKDDEFCGLILSSFIGVASELTFLLSRGKFDASFKEGKANGHLSLAVQYLEWCPEVRAEMAKTCVGISMLETFMTKVLPVVCPGAKKLAPCVEQAPRINVSVLLG